MTGNDPTTKSNVLKALQLHHGYSPTKAQAVAETHKEVVDDGVKMKSFLYYTVDRLLDEEGHECGDDCTEFEDEEDENT